MKLTIFTIALTLFALSSYGQPVPSEELSGGAQKALASLPQKERENLAKLRETISFLSEEDKKKVRQAIDRCCGLDYKPTNLKGKEEDRCCGLDYKPTNLKGKEEDRCCGLDYKPTNLKASRYKISRIATDEDNAAEDRRRIGFIVRF
ncbi:unnamed protein product [Cyprideis torosa]|uniref:Uncharacterized protein n=1 Tax=Cyprideis torosa TaxID=163714 RepID=A0A7R8ZGR7_9CRUS|nr:unnamed protein product [Cyprideis torosa]CAG0882030.1 unnamed protein product [Cyprideis torosa]